MSDTAIPQWAVSSVVDWLRPFFSNTGAAMGSYLGSGGGENRHFLREVERNLRVPLEWHRGDKSALESLALRVQTDEEFFVQVIDFALRNILIGYTFQEVDEAAGELDRILRESGSVWEVAQVPRRVEYFLRRRTATATGDAIRKLEAERGRDVEHLSLAWAHAYGRSPNPSEAYREAVKAVEAVAIPVVLPNDPQATLGKVVASMRQSPTKWTSIFQRPVTVPGTSSASAAPVEVVVLMLDLLWRNQTDRHGVASSAPVVSGVTQEQAEFAVHLALVLVHAFRSGAIA